MATPHRVAVVTGGNRGIGFEVCRQLAGQGLRVILTARDETKAREAVETIHGEGLDVVPHPLDVTDVPSVTRLERFVRDQFGRLDILINNAGVALDRSHGAQGILNLGDETLRETLETNLYGPLRLCRTLVPLMQEHGYGRVVNVSSQMGSLAGMGTSSPAYRISKAALNALTRILAAEVRGTNILVNSAHPGWVRTAMGGPQAPLVPEQGAETIVWLATLPDDGPTGGFFHGQRPLEW